MKIGMLSAYTKLPPDGNIMRLKRFFAAVTMFAAAACAAPVDARFLSGATTLEESSPPLLTLLDFEGAADVTAANDINFTDPTGSYYLAWDSLGNEYIFTGTWTGVGSCT